MVQGEESAQKSGWVRRVLGIDLAPLNTLPTGLAAWQAARSAAIDTLDLLADAVDTLPIPEAPEAIILLRSIRANLTEAPTTPQQIEELRRYLETDDVIAEAEDPNGFGITVELRTPLLAALNAIQPAQAGT
jgi:hypothetical protein